MSYLSMLEKQKLEKEKYEKETLTLKEQILKINDLYTIWDGHFLSELNQFLTDYEKYRKQDISPSKL